MISTMCDLCGLCGLENRQPWQTEEEATGKPPPSPNYNYYFK
jgi:hypothetical protein